jgi:hypothetical protein
VQLPTELIGYLPWSQALRQQIVDEGVAAASEHLGRVVLLGADITDSAIAGCSVANGATGGRREHPGHKNHTQRVSHSDAPSEVCRVRAHVVWWAVLDSNQ